MTINEFIKSLKLSNPELITKYTNEDGSLRLFDLMSEYYLRGCV